MIGIGPAADSHPGHPCGRRARRGAGSRSAQRAVAYIRRGIPMTWRAALERRPLDVRPAATGVVIGSGRDDCGFVRAVRVGPRARSGLCRCWRTDESVMDVLGGGGRLDAELVA